MANKHLVFTRVNRCHKCCAYYLATRKNNRHLKTMFIQFYSSW